MEENINKNFALTWLPKKTFEILATISWNEIGKAKTEALTKANESLEVNGFRKGKAPLNLIEEKLGSDRVLEITLENIIPNLYSKAIKELGLHPISSPKVELVSAKENENWQVKFISCEEPEVKLGNYKEEVKKQKVTEAIWTPEKGTQPEKKDEKNPDDIRDEKLDKIISWLIANIKVEISAILIDSEVNRKLSELLSQVQKLGLTIDQYLSSTGKSAESLRNEYKTQAERTISVQLILNAIAEGEKIEVTPEEIEKAVSSAKSEEEKKALESQKYVLASIIRQQKTLDFLANLL